LVCVVTCLYDCLFHIPPFLHFNHSFCHWLFSQGWNSTQPLQMHDSGSFISSLSLWCLNISWCFNRLEHQWLFISIITLLYICVG
jgi:hypothetical protein